MVSNDCDRRGTKCTGADGTRKRIRLEVHATLSLHIYLRYAVFIVASFSGLSSLLFLSSEDYLLPRTVERERHRPRPIILPNGKPLKPSLHGKRWEQAPKIAVDATQQYSG